ncbi:MAG: TldD/PmbA family protein, partial [Bacteroidales bacterium]|nr:TldD/PmbA family protein [Bacteroidales bacterium]
MKNHFLQAETALSHFSVSIADIQQVLQMALSEGGDYADLFFEDSLSNSLQLSDGHVNSVASGMD